MPKCFVDVMNTHPESTYGSLESDLLRVPVRGAQLLLRAWHELLHCQIVHDLNVCVWQDLLLRGVSLAE